MSDDNNKSRWSVLSDIQANLEIIAANQERLERHMKGVIRDYRQMSEEDRLATAAQFPKNVGGNIPVAQGSGPAGAALAAGDFDAGHGGTGPIRFLPGYIGESFL